MKKLTRCAVILFVILVLIPSRSSSGEPAFEKIVRKVFGTNRVVFSHTGEMKFKENQKVYLYSGEKFIGAGRICSIYSDENYTCEVPGDVYESVSPGDTVSDLPPEKYREKVQKIRENLKRAKAAIPSGVQGEEVKGEDATRMSSPEIPETDSVPGGHNLIQEGDKLAARGDSISLESAEEKYLTALKTAILTGRDIISPLQALASFHVSRDRCDEAVALLENHLSAALADYPSDAWGRAISAINIQANNLIYKEQFTCAENLLTTLAAALEPEVRDERTGFYTISVYERLSYLYGELAESEKANAYREASGRIKEEYGIDRYIREQDISN